MGEQYKNENRPPSAIMNEDATLLGPRAMFYNSILALSASIVIPWLVVDNQRAVRRLDAPINNVGNQSSCICAIHVPDFLCSKLENWYNYGDAHWVLICRY